PHHITVPFLLNIFSKQTSQQETQQYVAVPASERMFCCGDKKKNKKKRGTVKGTVVLMKKNFLEIVALDASILDRIHELLGRRVSLQLISSVHGDPQNGNKGKVGKPAYLENWIPKLAPFTAGEISYTVAFEWEEQEIGVPGAFLIKNNHHSEFLLKSLTLEDVPGEGRIHFVCDSWVYPAHVYDHKDRVFFANKTYLPQETPLTLVKYREEELVTLRGNGEGELQEWDRVYDYAYYNDLGDPDRGPKYARPILGGSVEFSYPRRGRTGRPPSKSGNFTSF
ncbi:Linoleate 9S-lipoxygenase 1, partial [Linum grandiflorum]